MSLMTPSLRASQAFRPQRLLPGIPPSIVSRQRQPNSQRHVTDLASTKLLVSNTPQIPSSTARNGDQKPLPPLSKMPLTLLLRSLMLNYIMAIPILRGPCMGVLRLAAISKSAIFNPERNPVLAAILYSTAYKQFCAGRNPAEVQQTIASVKSAGFSGVVLCYAREVVLDKNGLTSKKATADKYEPVDIEAVQQWKEGLISTIDCLGPGDILAIKFTGAGRIALDALKTEQPMPEPIKQALYVVCDRTARQGSTLWLDAEQSVLQPTIDTWTIDLMRKYNRNGMALVSNTIQAYLKSSPENIHRHLKLAAEEGWTLGIKLVRGAYIESDPRHLLHDSIEDTHSCFNTIATDLINMRMPSGTERSLQFPKTQLFIATHNSESVRKAQTAQYTRLRTGKPTIGLEFGQLQGMADEISYELVQQSEKIKRETGWKQQAAPKAFKYLTWGTLSECLGYLHRRAVENRGAVARTRHMAKALRQELSRRVWALWRHSVKWTK